MKRLAVISAGLGVPSSTRLLADRLTAAVRETYGDGLEVDVIELRELAHAITDNLLTGFPNQALRSALEKVAGAAGLVAVTPVFTASYSGLFKSFVDVLEMDSLVGKPVLIAATGGTERHSLVLDHAMRPLFSYLRAVVVPTAVYAAASDWGTKDQSTKLAERVEVAASELAGLLAATPDRAPDDPYDNPTPFEQLFSR